MKFILELTQSEISEIVTCLVYVGIHEKFGTEKEARTRARILKKIKLVK